MSSNPNMPKKKEHRALRFIVISMGLLLIGGTIALFTLIIQRSTSEEGDDWISKITANKNAPVVSDIANVPTGCGNAPLDFRGRGGIIALEIEPDRIHAITKPDNAPTAVVTIDRCTGEILSQQTIVGDSTTAVAAPATEEK